MRFPKACEIAMTKVVAIDIKKSIYEAIEKMIANEHRDIIIIDGNDFYILRALDIINIHGNKIDLADSLDTLSLIKLPAINKNTNILQMLPLLDEPTEYICTINDDGSLYGIITHTDITSHIDPETLMDNYKINDFLKLIQNVKWVNKDVQTREILQDMFEESLDSIIIVEELQPIGILTTKDIIKLIKENKELSLSISNYMTTPIDTVNKDISIREALEFIKQKHYKRVIVVNDDKTLLGVVTQKELITLTYVNWSSILKEHQEELQEINIMLESQNKKYKSLASKDRLTNLYNRYKFEQLYYSIQKTLLQQNKSLVLIIIDIDHFKQVNDTYGHNVGDAVLKQFADLLIKHTRESDIVSRWGGEEFIILLSNIDIQTACMVADKLRTTIEKRHFETVEHITASFGITHIQNYSTLQESVEKADKALYKAKKSGRNCIKIETGE